MEKFKSGQYIRIGGATISDALFIPPVHTSVPELMSIEMPNAPYSYRCKQLQGDTETTFTNI